MKTIKLIAVAFAALAAVSCVKDNMGGADSKTYQASFTDRLPDAKATISVGQEESLVSWETSDRVGIMYGASNLEYKADQAGSHSTLSAVSASADASEVWALLPYDPSATLSAGVINTILPSEQPAKADASFHHLAVAHSTSANLAFSNVCGLVRVKVTTEGITKVVFAGKSQEKVAGNISITVADCSVSGADAESVALVPAEGETSIAVGDYFLAVLPQKFENGFTVTAYKGETAVQTKDIAATVTLERCGIIAGTIREVTISAISTDFATVGETITLTGTGFSETVADNAVTIGGKNATVKSSTQTQLQVEVPKGLSRNTDYSIDVIVKGGTKVSSPKFRYWYLYKYALSGWLGAWNKYTVTGGTGANASIGDPFFIGIDPNDADLMWMASCNPNVHTDGNPKYGILSVKLSTAETTVECVDESLNGPTLWGGDFEPGTSKFHLALKAGIGENKTVFAYNGANSSFEFYDPMQNASPALNNASYLIFDSNKNKFVADRDNSRIAVIQSGKQATYVALGLKPISLALDKTETYMFIGTNGGYGIYRVKVADLLNTSTTSLTPERIAGTGTKLTDTKANGGNGKATEGSVGNVQAFYYDPVVNYLYYLDSQSLLFQALIPGIGGDWTKATMKTVHNQTSAFDNSGGMIEKDASGNFYIAVKGKHKIVKLTQD